MLPELAIPKQIKEGKTRKHNETCWHCYPHSCSCPQIPQEVHTNLKCYLSEYDKILTDKEKISIQKEIAELETRYKIQDT